MAHTVLYIILETITRFNFTVSVLFFFSIGQYNCTLEITTLSTQSQFQCLALYLSGQNAVRLLNYKQHNEP